MNGRERETRHTGVPGGRQLFIYYRVPVADAPAVLQAVQQAQQTLVRERPGLIARLLQRPGPDTQAPLTVMEVYGVEAALQPDGVDPATQDWIEHRLHQALASCGPELHRHLEIFDELPPCAS